MGNCFIIAKNTTGKISYLMFEYKNPKKMEKLQTFLKSLIYLSLTTLINRFLNDDYVT